MSAAPALRLSAVEAVLLHAQAAGLGAPWGDGSPVIEILVKGGSLTLRLRGRQLRGLRNAGDVTPPVTEIAVVINPGIDGPAAALGFLEQAIEAMEEAAA